MEKVNCIICNKIVSESEAVLEPFLVPQYYESAGTTKQYYYICKKHSTYQIEKVQKNFFESGHTIYDLTESPSDYDLT